jgi:outer membrane protein
MKQFVFRSLFIALLMGSAALVSAQKTGYVSVEEVIGMMPKAEEAGKQLDSYRQALLQQYTEYRLELRSKDSLYTKDSAILSKEAKEVKLEQLQSLAQKVQEFEGAFEQKIQEKQQALLIPLRNEALEAVKAVAKESGYAYILDANTVIVGPPGENVLPLVKKKMGIKDAPAAAAPAAGTKPAPAAGGRN